MVGAVIVYFVTISLDRCTSLTSLVFSMLSFTLFLHLQEVILKGLVLSFYLVFSLQGSWDISIQVGADTGV